MLKNIYTSNYIMNINYMLTGGGLEKPYKIRNYKEFKNKSIDEISSNR